MHLNKFIFLLYICICLTSICLTSCKNENRKHSDIVARIEDNYVITYNNLRKFVFDRFYHKMYKDEFQAYHKALNVMVANQLKCKDFMEKGKH